MEFDELQRHWNQLGVDDPLWAILSTPGKEGGRWELEEFLRSGVTDVGTVLDMVNEFSPDLARTAALDFGCGVGRLTQPLCNHFGHVWGIDIAPSMIDYARRINRYPDRCTYVLNSTTSLSVFDTGTFDLVNSTIVLQHMRPELFRGYILEFLRVLKTRGVAVFQLPAPMAQPERNLADEALPKDAYRAAISIAAPVSSASAGSTLFLEVRVRNISPHTWPGGPDSDSLICLGNHLLDRRGGKLKFDDARAPLPAAVGPGEEIALSLDIVLPAQPGEYILEFDMVHENVCWFARRGSKPLRMTLRIDPGSAEAAGPVRFIPRIEMYGAKPNEILALIDSAGGELLLLKQDFAAAPPWRSYRYCIRKR